MLRYIIAGCAVVAVVFLAVISIRTMSKERTANQSQQGQGGEMNPLTLKDYPKLFSENVIIVVGEHAIEAENESAIAIRENLIELTGNEPISKNDIEVSELDKKACNLILVGIPTTNSVVQEVCGKEYPGEKKAILEISKNPWNWDKALLIVAASDECGVNTVSKTLTDGKEVRELSNEIIQFKEFEIGDKIVYFHQRMIDGAIVEKDYIMYQFDKNTKALLSKKIHWRTGLPEHITTAITKEQAESMAKGKAQFIKLYIISPESVVFPVKPTPQNPCWVVRSVEDGHLIVTIIDGVEGKVLGFGVPPPAK